MLLTIKFLRFFRNLNSNSYFNFNTILKLYAMTKNCIVCQTKLVGRDGRKFCSDACRIEHHNQLNRSGGRFVRMINERLRKNHRILCELNCEGITKTNRASLVIRGFDFNLITMIERSSNGENYFYIYDQGYRMFDNEHYLLVKRE